MAHVQHTSAHGSEPVLPRGLHPYLVFHVEEGLLVQGQYCSPDSLDYISRKNMPMKAKDRLAYRASGWCSPRINHSAQIPQDRPPHRFLSRGQAVDR